MLAASLLFALAPAALVSAAPTRLRASRSISSTLAGLFGASSSDKPAALDPQTAESEFLRPALFAQAAYCSTPAVQKWACGSACDALGKDINVLIAGGNDGTIPGYFVALDPSTDSVVVSHQGTDASNILSILNDAEFLLADVNTTLIPGATSAMQVHSGFSYTQGRTADDVLATVKGAISDKKASNIKVFGHSLGAAIAMLDALMLKAALPNVPQQTVTFGLPRYGNPEFADFTDAQLGTTFQFITNQHDPVPEVPPRAIGYAHPSNEVHIASVDATSAVPKSIVACPGQDNTNCATGNNLIEESTGDHKGPYFRPEILLAHSGCAA